MDRWMDGQDRTSLEEPLRSRSPEGLLGRERAAGLRPSPAGDRAGSQVRPGQASRARDTVPWAGRRAALRPWPVSTPQESLLCWGVTRPGPPLPVPRPNLFSVCLPPGGAPPPRPCGATACDTAWPGLSRGQSRLPLPGGAQTQPYCGGPGSIPAGVSWPQGGVHILAPSVPLCDLRPVARPLCAAASPSVKQDGNTGRG